MGTSRKKNIFIIIGVLIVLGIGGYYSYRRQEEARNNGVYTIAFITRQRVARNGWKVKAYVEYKNKTYHFNGLVPWEVFSINGTDYKRFFAKILDYKPGDGYWPVFIMQVPDSIKSAPPEGWSETWMKEHFPQVVDDVYDIERIPTPRP